MSDRRVLVVEDDPIVARVHCRFVAGVPGYRVVGAARTAAEADAMVAREHPDLVLLDLGLPDRSGIELLRGLRARGEPIEAIAVTAASQTAAVRDAIHLGVVDYLVKPFDVDRLRRSLSLYRSRVASLSGTRLDQRAVDRLRSDGPDARRWLPRELSGPRLERVQQALRASPAPVTATELARRIGISRVTARRYLEYLVTIGGVEVSAPATGPGRPAKTYVAAARLG